MAGRFVSIEEAARLLGVGVDEVKRLVERKKLFPLHDGNFKVDEIERVRASLGDESSPSESLSLDLDLDGGDLTFDEPLAPGGTGSAPADAGSQTIVRGGGTPGSAADDLSGLALTADDDDTATDGGDLVLESNPGASSPSLGRQAAASGSLVGSAVSGGPAALEISDISLGSAADGLPGSQATGPVGAPASGAGSGFSTPADSGLSLEESGLEISGIDLDPGVAAAPGTDVDLDAGSFHGEEFNLGGGIGEEDSASVVIATEESGDSSFFTNVTDDSASVAIDSSIIGDPNDVLPQEIDLPSMEMRFSGWQIAGLTCCALILLTGGIVMYDLLSEIHKPQGTPISGLLLNAVGHMMGWRK